MTSTLRALVVALIAIAPGAIYTFAYERHADAYGVQLADRLVRFLAASAVFHASAAWPELEYVRRVIRGGWTEEIGWEVEVASVACVAIPYLAGSLVGWGATRDAPRAIWFVGRSRHPRAGDHLWSDGRQRIVRVALKSGTFLGGIFEPPDSYASGYGEEADLYLSRQFAVDPDDGTFLLDAEGLPVVYTPVVGLYIRASDVDFWHIQEVTSGV